MDERMDTCAASDKQLVVFELDGGFYGVDIGAVNTIIRTQELTSIPGVPTFVEGVLDLRGSVVPVIDLRRRLGLPTRTATNDSRIVVMETDAGLVGMSVDSVAETLRLPQESLEPPSPVLLPVDSGYVKAIGKLPDRLITLLELDMIVPQ